jgi:hypothetical protein
MTLVEYHKDGDAGPEFVSAHGKALVRCPKCGRWADCERISAFMARTAVHLYVHSGIVHQRAGRAMVQATDYCIVEGER